MKGLRYVLAFACLAVVALAPPAMASPTDFGDPAYASIDQDATAADFGAIVVSASPTNFDAPARSFGGSPYMLNASIFVVGATGAGVFAPIDPGRDIA